MLVNELLKRLDIILNEIKNAKGTNGAMYEDVKNKIIAKNLGMRYNFDYKDIEILDINDIMKQKMKNVITEFNMRKNSITNSNLLIENLMKINGIGNEKAKELISCGLNNISELRYKKFQDMLSLESRLHYKFKPLHKIPRNLISEFENILKKNFNLSFTIGGSYRRGNEFSGDIDVLLIDKGKNDSFEILLNNPYIEVIPYMRGPDKMSAICKIKNNSELSVTIIEPVSNKSNSDSSNSNNVVSKANSKSNTINTSSNNVVSKTNSGSNVASSSSSSNNVVSKTNSELNDKYFQVDFMKTTKEEYVFMLLYITGSKEFNIKMRAIAKNKGYLLNQKGLFKVNNNKVDNNSVIVKNEKEIFDILEMEYLLPRKRI